MVRKSHIAIVLLLIYIVSPNDGISQSILVNKPNNKLIILKSALVPGWGQFDIQEKKAGKILLLTETGLFLILAESLRRSENAESRYRTYSAAHANVSTAGKIDQFFVDIGNYDNIDEYNQYQQRLRNPDNLYPSGKGYDWDWDSDKSRKKFKRYRVDRDVARKMTRFTLGGIVLNHIVSVIDMGYLLKRNSANSRLSVFPEVNTFANQFSIRFIFRF